MAGRDPIGGVTQFALSTWGDTSLAFPARSVNRGSLLVGYVRWESGDTTVTVADTANAKWTVVKSFAASVGVALIYSWSHPGGSSVSVTATLSSAQAYRAGALVELSGPDFFDPLDFTPLIYQDTSASGVAPKLFIPGTPLGTTFLAQGSFSNISFVATYMPARMLDAQSYSCFSMHDGRQTGPRFHSHDIVSGTTAIVGASFRAPADALFSTRVRRLWVPAGASGIPTLSAATAFNITATSAQPRVTITI